MHCYFWAFCAFKDGFPCWLGYGYVFATSGYPDSYLSKCSHLRFLFTSTFVLTSTIPTQLLYLTNLSLLSLISLPSMCFGGLCAVEQAVNRRTIERGAVATRSTHLICRIWCMLKWENSNGSAIRPYDGSLHVLGYEYRETDIWNMSRCRLKPPNDKILCDKHIS